MRVEVLRLCRRNLAPPPGELAPKATEIADEMLAICDDRDHWREKKESEFYQQKYNQYLWDKKQSDE